MLFRSLRLSLTFAVFIGNVSYAATSPTSLPGFGGGATIDGRGVRYSSPVIAEIDGDISQAQFADEYGPLVVNDMLQSGVLQWR